MGRLKRVKAFVAELVATGDELLLGRLADTNSAWITKRLTEEGARVKSITCVGDNVKDVRRVIQESLSRKPNLIVITGGLGPSFDDRTKEAIASALGKKIVSNKNALNRLQTRFKELSQSRGVLTKVPSRLKRLAYLVEGSEPLDNPVGIAPGMKLRFEKILIIALPGVPKEMKAIFKRSILPIIKKATGKRIVAKSLRVRIDRGVLHSIIKKILEAHPNLYIKTYAGDITRLGIKIDILCEAKTREACKKLLNSTVEELKNLVGEKGGLLTLAEESIKSGTN